MATGDLKVRITGDASDLKRDLLDVERSLDNVEPRIRRLYAAAFWQGWAAGAAVVTILGAVVERVF